MGFRNIFSKKASVVAAQPPASPLPASDTDTLVAGLDLPGAMPLAYSSSIRPPPSHSEGSLIAPQSSKTSAHPVSSTNSTAVSTAGSSRNASAASLRAHTPPMSRQNSSASSRVSSSGAQAPQEQAGVSGSQQGLGRVSLLNDGGHEHHLKNARRQEKLGRMLREIVGTGQKVGNDAVSAVPEFLKQADIPEDKAQLTLMHGLVNKLAKGEVEVGRVNGSSHQWKRSLTADKTMRSNNNNCTTPEIHEATVQSLAQKYGRCQEVIGRGSYGVVRVSHRQDGSGREQLFAVKEFRKRSTESATAYQDRLMSEFCISSALHHTNIIHTFDLMKDTHGGCCQIMEYCSGGDLYSLILSSGTGLTAVEADCFFKQILRGVVYMHSMGVAHCDLKPENILLTQNGVCKISDFGNGECFRMAWETEVHYSKGVFGSGPYIAPEEFKGKPFDPRAADIWALGVIYMVARTGSYLWRKANAEEDEHYAKYLRGRKTAKGYGPVERLTPSKCVYVIYSILDPVPTRRITGKQILNSEWGRSIRVCEHAEPKERISNTPAQSHASVATQQRLVQEV